MSKCVYLKQLFGYKLEIILFHSQHLSSMRLILTPNSSVNTPHKALTKTSMFVNGLRLPHLILAFILMLIYCCCPKTLRCCKAFTVSVLSTYQGVPVDSFENYYYIHFLLELICEILRGRQIPGFFICNACKTVSNSFRVPRYPYPIVTTH